jgi:hypothetical protein
MNRKLDPSILIIAPDSPTSFSPAGERIRNLAIASGRFFLGKTLVLTIGRERSSRKNRVREEGVSLCTVNLTRASPFPLSVFLDPITLGLFLTYATLLFRRRITMLRDCQSNILGNCSVCAIGDKTLRFARCTDAKTRPLS